MSTTDEREALIHAQRPAFDNDGPPYTLDGMDPLLRGLIVNAVHGAMATKAPPPANHWLTASWEIGRAMTNAVSEPAAPVNAPKYIALRAKGVLDADDNLDAWDTPPYDIATRHVEALNERDPSSVWRLAQLYVLDDEAAAPAEGEKT